MSKNILFIGVLLTSLLMLRFFFFFSQQPVFRQGQQFTLKTTLFSQPQTIGNKQRIIVLGEHGERFIVTTSAYPRFMYGDTVTITGTIDSMIAREESTLDMPVLDYAQPGLISYFPKIEREEERSFFLHVLSSFREHVASLFQRALPPNSASLLLGIVFGIKQDMDQDFFTQLQTTGVLHIVAASGMNVTMVGGCIAAIGSIFFRRQFVLLLSIGGILCYAALAGFESSIIRAAIMGGLVFAAQIIGRATLASYLLGIAAWGMLLISPFLLFDIGFQLSFLATLGLLYLTTALAQMKPLQMITTRTVIGADISTTVAAQLATLPVLLANFGTYSLWSVVVNASVLWMIPILMILGALAALTSIVFPFLSVFFLYLAYPFLWLFEQIIGVFSKKGGVIAVSQLTWPLIIGYYLLLLTWVLTTRKQEGYAEKIPIT